MKEIKFVCILELDMNLLVDKVHPSFAGVVLHFVYENDTFDLKGTFKDNLRID